MYIQCYLLTTHGSISGRLAAKDDKWRAWMKINFSWSCRAQMLQLCICKVRTTMQNAMNYYPEMRAVA